MQRHIWIIAKIKQRFGGQAAELIRIGGHSSHIVTRGDEQTVCVESVRGEGVLYGEAWSERAVELLERLRGVARGRDVDDNESARGMMEEGARARLKASRFVVAVAEVDEESADAVVIFLLDLTVVVLIGVLLEVLLARSDFPLTLVA
jgi:phage terminase Nu1 subunit (DNA packaging protein)